VVASEYKGIKHFLCRYYQNSNTFDSVKVLRNFQPCFEICTFMYKIIKATREEKLSQARRVCEQRKLRKVSKEPWYLRIA
jgi:hypothetical protein